MVLIHRLAHCISVHCFQILLCDSPYLRIHGWLYLSCNKKMISGFTAIDKVIYLLVKFCNCDLEALQIIFSQEMLNCTLPNFAIYPP
jgi:hypothetical protein